MLMEAVAETSEEYMERYFEGGTFTREEVSLALRQTVIEGDIIPVLMGSSVMRYGPHAVLKAIKKYFPSPVKDNVIYHGVNQKTEEAYVAEYDSSKPVSAYIFKTIVDPFVGKFSLVKVCDGVLKKDSVLYNAEKGEYYPDHCGNQEPFPATQRALIFAGEKFCHGADCECCRCRKGKSDPVALAV